MISTTLVIGTSAKARDAAIAAALATLGNDGTGTALILEGLPDGSMQLEQAFPHARIARIAPGCLCCAGNLTMRVTLNRMLRTRPAHLYIGLATAGHLDNIRAFLAASPYENLLTLTKDLHA